MDAYSPINGITLERYAELAADVSEISDPRAQAETVARKGVSAVDWETAKAGWTARMQDPGFGGQVGAHFMPLYQAALARKNGQPPPPYPQQPAPYPNYPPARQVGYPPQQPFNNQAANFGNEVGKAFNAFGSALDSFVSSAVGGISVGGQVLVLWSDGQRYPGVVRAMQNNQVFVAFPDGRQVWVPQHVVSPKAF